MRGRLRGRGDEVEDGGREGRRGENLNHVCWQLSSFSLSLSLVCHVVFSPDFPLPLYFPYRHYHHHHYYHHHSRTFQNLKKNKL